MKVKYENINKKLIILRYNNINQSINKEINNTNIALQKRNNYDDCSIG